MARHSARYLAYLQSPEWALKRAAVLRRANGRCEDCGERKRPLQIHHSHYRDLWDEREQDLRALCLDCHRDADYYRDEKLEDETERRQEMAAKEARLRDPTCPYCGATGMLRSQSWEPRSGITPHWTCATCGQSWWRDEREDILWIDGKEQRRTR